LHDIATLDSRGVPGCMIITEAFTQAATLQSKALGFEPAIVWVAHPVQNLTPAELASRAAGAVDEAIQRITP
jgi:hypothetical protein